MPAQSYNGTYVPAHWTGGATPATQSTRRHSPAGAALPAQIGRFSRARAWRFTMARRI